MTWAPSSGPAGAGAPRQLRPTEVKRLNREWRRASDTRLALLLDSVAQPFNVGSIVRSAAAFGVEQLWLCGNTAPLGHPGVGKTALGTQRLVEATQEPNPVAAAKAAAAAGLRVVACGDPADAYAMIQLAVSSDDPVIFFEPKRRYWDRAEVDTAGGLAAALPLHRARTVVSGDDATVLCYGPMVKTCAAAAVAAESDGRSLEVIDLRSIVPLDEDLDLSPILRQTVKSQNSMNGEFDSWVWLDGSLHEN